jgi:hypothetical protein
MKANRENPKKPTHFECVEIKENGIVDFITQNVKREDVPEYLQDKLFDSIEIYKNLKSPKHFELFFRNNPSSSVIYPAWYRYNAMYN